MSNHSETPMSLTPALKRAAEDALPSPPHKYLRTLTASPLPDLSSIKSIPLSEGDASLLSSINGILRKHAGERLYIKPLHWTTQHVQLLRCIFLAGKRFPVPGKPLSGEAEAGQTIKESDTVDKKGNAEAATEDVMLARSIKAAIVQCCSPKPNVLRASFMRHALVDHGLYISRSRLPFYFARKPVSDLRIDGAFASSRTGPLSFALLDLDALAKRRDESITKGRLDQANPLVARLWLKKQNRLRPPDALQDPYLVAILITLAQGIAREHQEPPLKDQQASMPSTPTSEPSLNGDESSDALSKPPGFKVRVLAMTGRHLYLYTACISAGFLGQFDDPSQESVTEPFTVSYRRLPTSSSARVSHIISTVVWSMSSGS